MDFVNFAFIAPVIPHLNTFHITVHNAHKIEKFSAPKIVDPDGRFLRIRAEYLLRITAFFAVTVFRIASNDNPAVAL